MPKHLSVELKGRIIGAYEFGITPSIIAKKHSILISTVLKVIKKWEKDGTVVPKKAPGRPPILGELGVGQLIDEAMENNRSILQAKASGRSSSGAPRTRGIYPRTSALYSEVGDQKSRSGGAIAEGGNQGW
ncbi:hypothetical protein BGZ50_008645 [Haplosporangium sp. Z 11]|nr:hypothetical protein BGZ50_008645 [Haplosporangium sp. Z 11]